MLIARTASILGGPFVGHRGCLMFDWPTIHVHVESEIKTTVNVTIQFPKGNIMSNEHVQAAATGTLDSNLLNILVAVLKSVLGLNEPIPTVDAFKIKIAELVATAETITALTSTTVDDGIVAQVKSFVSNPIVANVLWIIYQRLVITPSKAEGLDVQSLSAMLSDELGGS